MTVFSGLLADGPVISGLRSAPRSASHQSGILEIGIPHGYPPAGRRAPDRLDLGTVVLSAVGIGLGAFGNYILARARFARL